MLFVLAVSLCFIIAAPAPKQNKADGGTYQFFFMNIFVAKLSYNTNEDTLRTRFEEFGEVSSAKIIYDKIENRSKTQINSQHLHA